MIPQPTLHVLGAYKLEVTDALLHEAIETKYSGMTLSDHQRQAVEESVREELASVILIEVLVEDADERFNAGDFGQAGSDQAAYDEAYLTADGTSVTSRLGPPQVNTYRVAFFLHFFEPDEPLMTSYGEIPVPAIQEMPNRLHSLVPYEPVD